MSKRFLCYETDDADQGKVNVDENGVLIACQPDWNEHDSSSPAFILNKPESLGSGVTWFSMSGSSKTSMSIRAGEDWESGSVVTAEEVVNAFEGGVVRCRITYISCGVAEHLTGSMMSYEENVYANIITCWVKSGTSDYGTTMSKG